MAQFVLVSIQPNVISVALFSTPVPVPITITFTPPPSPATWVQPINVGPFNSDPSHVTWSAPAPPSIAAVPLNDGSGNYTVTVAATPSWTGGIVGFLQHLAGSVFGTLLRVFRFRAGGGDSISVTITDSTLGTMPVSATQSFDAAFS